ncbi:MAG: 4-hydroxy-2-oxovalerate aldolase [Methanoregula sp.]|jgi:4-hydroxy 2-oxovalerate aldolase|uniref:4-hydroxy-2-oxovalerate aldolase n=1 Tax=Methanoregula sp. TaxID=2052170 RepID=UPI003D103686
MSKILIHDVTLRDGNHAISHKMTAHQIAVYASAANAAGIPTVEVGHGNGIGASSLQVGESAIDDEAMLREAKKNLTRSKLAVHVIPGFATINKDLKKALDLGVDVVRVAAHCTEADLTQRHINFVRDRGKEVYGVLMMSHMASKETLVEEAQKMESYGAEGVIIFDSAGAYVPDEVSERISLLAGSLNIPVGFHAHNNLGLAIANSIAAAQAGATIIDGSARGFGAGAGNAQIEAVVAVLEKLGYSTGIDLYKILDASEIAETDLMKEIPRIRSLSIISGLSGVFSAFSKPVERISKEYNVDPRDVFFELGRRQVVAGQEDMIIEVASELSAKRGGQKP